jgi:spermidine synthase
MAQPWVVLDSVATGEGTLELRQRGEADFLITVNSLVLMNSSLHRSEVALGEMACGHLKQQVGPRVLVGGLGMAFTLKAVLDNLPASGSVVVAELNPVVLDWCRGPLAPLTGAAVSDPRVTVEIANVADVIRKSAIGKERFDAIVLDLYTGPHAKSHKVEDPLYGSIAIEMTRAALKPGGVFAVWGENYDQGFDKRLKAAGFSVSSDRPGRGGLRHVVYLARIEPRREAARHKEKARSRG